MVICAQLDIRFAVIILHAVVRADDGEYRVGLCRQMEQEDCETQVELHVEAVADALNPRATAFPS